MPPAALPGNELQQLGGLMLFELLGAEPEVAFDELTELACRLCGVPIAVVNLVDSGRRWTKSSFGLSAGKSDALAFSSSHVEVGKARLVVTDTTIDPRTADLPIVVGPPHIRFLAVVPLFGNDRDRLGDLYVCDTKVRRFTAKQSKDLELVGRQLSAQIDVRRLSAALGDGEDRLSSTQLAYQESQRRFETLCSLVPVGVFQTDSKGRCIGSNEIWRRIFGVECNGGLGFGWLTRVHPDDQDLVLSEWQKISIGDDFQADFRCMNPDGRVRCVRSHASPVYSNDGKPIGYVGCVEEVAERELAQSRWESQNNWFQLLTNSLPHLTWSFLPNGYCDFLSQQWEAYTGVPEECQLGTGWLDHLHPDDQQPALELWQTKIPTGTPFDTQFRILGGDGEYRWFQASVVPIHDSVGNIVKWIGSNTNIQAIRTSEERYERAIRGASAGIWDWNILTGEVYYSPRFRTMLGVTADEFPDVFGSFMEVLHPDDVEAVRCALDDHFSDPTQPYDIEIRLRKKSGEYRYFHSNGALFRDEGGVPHRMAGSIVDVTSRREIENEVRATSNLLRQFIRYTPAAVAVLDREMRYLQVSDRWLRDYNIQDDSIIGKSHYDVFPDIPDRWKRIHARVLQGHTIRNEEDPFERADGTTEYLAWEAQPWRNANQEIGGLIFFTQVITERKRAQAELIMARELAEAASRSKSDFLANMSHEIRTPLTAILGYADLLSEPLPGDQHASYLTTIKRAGNHLLSIINDILDLSKVESGKMTTERIPFSPADLVSDVISCFRETVRSKQLSIEVENKGPIPKTICSDPVRVRQILVNLIGNAVKFTESGGVRLTVRLEFANREPMLAFDIADTGIGMTEEQCGLLFEPFVQADTSTTRKYGGTGLGLTICRRMAQILDGDVTVASVLGQGSTFTAKVATGSLDGIELFDGLVESGDHDVENQEEIRLNGHILLAEDSPANQVLIKTHLERAGARVDVVENGQLAVDKVYLNNSGATLDAYCLILMDMQMPVLDGCGATQQLRERGYTGPILALTANAMPEDRERCLAAGCNDFFVKPIDRTKLLAACRDWASTSTTLR